ncbi:UbiA-like protein EboC [Virgibacillus sp. NKC19-3]|uniref:UbiA-like protein EboC n=1 Tax=Virgibacillus saliphilus TaxID=2831674 RepID=UPI001C9B27CC|nr:UbiA-like protein EboC [Virgibacillus sp. NKC19-3]MBY7142814.1 UbiA-like protein EboC [Virgibacillus sp. NKC19-3]
MRSNLRSYFELVRLPNLFTAMADISAGGWIAVGTVSYFFTSFDFLFLLLASISLYAMGMVWNDYFDVETDRVERPERPIPSGRILPSQALILGIILGVLGIVFAAFVNWMSLLIAFTIVCAVLLYDYDAKHHAVFGPIVMGGCRALNLLLGVSILSDQVGSYWWVSLFGFMYIIAVTYMAQGEVGDQLHPLRVRIMAVTICLCVGGVTLLGLGEHATVTVIAIILFAGWTFKGVGPALRRPIPPRIQKAVGTSIVGYPLLNAAIASIFGGWLAFVTVAIFLGFSYLFSHLFAVT